MTTCRYVSPWITVAATLFAFTGTLPAQQDQTAATLALARRNLSTYLQRAPGILAEEHQTQRILKSSGAVNETRTLVADVALIRFDNRTLFYRDVMAVDAKPVKNREQRLQRLFLSAARPTEKQAQAISDESRRYDFEPRFNVVTLPIFILLPRTTSIFTFSRDGADLAFEESGSPTILKEGTSMRNLKNYPLHGRLTIDSGSGAVTRAVLLTSQPAVEFSADLRYVMDARLNLWVLSEVRERYKRKGRDAIEITSTYVNYRQFTVTTDERPVDSR